MAEEKPMTIKDRMAALARASSGGSSVPSPAPPKSSAAPPGTSVAERLAKMRGPSPGAGAGAGGIGQSPSGGPGPKNSSLSRSSTPPSAPTINTKSPGTPSGGSRVADRIAMMSGSASPSPGSTSPGVSRTVSSTSSGVSRTVSGGSEPRMQAMNVKSCSAGGGGEEEGASTASSPSSTKSPRKPGKVSAGLAARMNKINLDSSAGGGGGEGEGREVAAASASEELELPPPPGTVSSGSSPRVSPGLAARLQALGAAPGGPAGESSSPGRGGGGGDAPGNGTGRVHRMGGVCLPGMGMGIPMPGAMPPGGIAELKRRKKEAERAAEGGGEAAVDATTPTDEPVAEQKPGELQHANLSRATMPQRRRPRKAARPFKATATTTTPPPVTTTSSPPAVKSPAVRAASSRATRTFSEKSIEDAGTSPAAAAAAAATSPAVKAASPPAAATIIFQENEAEGVVAPSEAACALPDAGSGRTMDAMLQAASAKIAGENDDEEDGEWD